ncbi:hypothetical protein H9649_10935 [Sporosarcina sp. Sa2YVA2]|uniref:DUF3139 domain-containing protein n=1 Tax=Sporosarcina quadrami TaxID=2762234 RepID=A0ABR8UAQ0_9BACL|nr:hypothetical protein [Sporosarcina quadrami]MBD7985103.1 hypothetical protein [Sporosarcina quadrami]
MKKLSFVFGVILLVIILSFISPYNLLHHFNAESKVTKILADPEVKLALLDDETEIENIKYLGSNFYQVKTEDGIYVMELKNKESTHIIDVFEHKIHVKQYHGK